jgi:hypothetical protein
MQCLVAKLYAMKRHSASCKFKPHTLSPYWNRVTASKLGPPMAVVNAQVSLYNRLSLCECRTLPTQRYMSQSRRIREPDSSDDAVTQCFIANRNSYQPEGPSCPVPEPK